MKAGEFTATREITIVAVPEILETNTTQTGTETKQEGQEKTETKQEAQEETGTKQEKQEKTKTKNKLDAEPKTGTINPYGFTAIILSISILGIAICVKKIYK